MALYKNLFPEMTILKDSSNNAQPTKLISEITPYKKTTDDSKKDGKERIQNYQISHLFGRTKNPFLFTAAWNIAYVPKYLDAFTGHESQGEHSKAFKVIFNDILKARFSVYVDDYNKLIKTHVGGKLEEALDKTRKDAKNTIRKFARFRSDAKHELSEI
jgi:hypothetical protein